MRDFTLKKYQELILAVLDAGHAPLTVRDYFAGRHRGQRCAVLRHEVDRRPGNALRVGENLRN